MNANYQRFGGGRIGDAVVLAGVAMLLSAQAALAQPATLPAPEADPDPAMTAANTLPEQMATQPAPATRPGVAVVRRKPPRPMSTPQEYADQAAKLREAYSKPADQWPEAEVLPGVDHREIGREPAVAYPADNPKSKAKEELGKQLFFDPRLSGSGQIACASCHDPDLGWADGRTVAFGHQRTALKRNAPTILDAAYSPAQFWDGRATTLEDQATFPIVSHDEMRGDLDTISKRLSGIEGYRNGFKAAFDTQTITADLIAKAIASFERTVVSGRSRFDQFVGGRKDALSDEAVRGLHLFRTDAACINCHNGPNFTDGKFHNIGLTYYGRPLEDLGRYRVTQKKDHVGQFRTPTLRNVGRTRPYMHNGVFDLDGVLNMYNVGAATEIPQNDAQRKDPLFPQKDPFLHPLGLNSHDLADVKAFLLSLDEPPTRMRAPALPEEAAPTTRPAAAK